MMSDKKISPIYRADLHSVKHYARIMYYPCGVVDIMASSHPIFGDKGWEISENWAHPKKIHNPEKQPDNTGRKSDDPKGEDLSRSMRRAKANLRRIALANDFRWFVTLTLNPEFVDTHDGTAVVKKLNAWCSNMVQRKGLKYILVPERHKKGGIHFHGFFNDCLEVVDSGHTDKQGHVIFNLPQWTLGFTTAIELYDDYQKAVGYVCKYIGKQGEKPAGRWYYSGGDLASPKVEYMEISPAELLQMYPDQAFPFYPPGKTMAICNGIVHDQVQQIMEEGESYED